MVSGAPREGSWTERVAFNRGRYVEGRSEGHGFSVRDRRDPGTGTVRASQGRGTPTGGLPRVARRLAGGGHDRRGFAQEGRRLGLSRPRSFAGGGIQG